MVDVFCTKYFHKEETTTLATLQATKQRSGEDLIEYIKRFRDIALDCYDHCEEKTLVEMCMANMIREYIACLGESRNLLVRTIVVESLKNRPISETKFRQKKHSTSYGSIHW